MTIEVLKDRIFSQVHNKPLIIHCAMIDISVENINGVKTRRHLILRKGYTSDEFLKFIECLDTYKIKDYYYFKNGIRRLWIDVAEYSVVFFTDGSWIDVGEYDGSNKYVYHTKPSVPECLYKGEIKCTTYQQS